MKTRTRKISNLKHFKTALRTFLLVCLLYSTLAMKSAYAQFTTFFAPSVYNPSDPFNTNWNEPKNWSWYPGVEPGKMSSIKIVILSSCVINSPELRLFKDATMEVGSVSLGVGSNVTLTVYSDFINNGKIAGPGTLILAGNVQRNQQRGVISCNKLQGENIISQGAIDCDEINASTLKDEIFSFAKTTCRQNCDVDVQLFSNGSSFVNEGQHTGDVILTKGVFRNSGDYTGRIVSKNSFSRVTNSANMTISSTQVSEIHGMDNSYAGKLTINSPLVMRGNTTNSGLITNNSELDMRVGSTLYTTFTNEGTLTNNSSHLTMNNVSLENKLGLINGSGLITNDGRFYNHGIVAPGNSAGTLSFSSDASDYGTIQIELGGTLAGTEYDVYNVAGDHRLQSPVALQVSLIDGFNPSAGDAFTILTAGVRIGTFATTSLPALNPGLTWKLDYTIRDVTLRVEALVVPVTWLDFTVSSETQNGNNRAVLKWSTAEEINNEGFQVERSSDGRNWESQGFKAAHTKTAEQYNYDFTDVEPGNGIRYYRLKQIDYDGEYEYSVVRSINLEREGSFVSVFPNPSATGILNLVVDNKENQVLNIYDLSGKVVHTEKLSADDGVNNIAVNTAALSAGTYIIRITGGTQHLQQKWIKL